MRLVSLDLQAFDSILSFCDSTIATLNLWLTGNKLLQHKIASVTTTVRLENMKEVAFCQLPLFLKELRHLRKLHLNRNGHHLLHRSTSLSVIQSLSSTLVALQLKFKGATRLLFPEANVEPRDGTKSAAWDIKTAFPILETLQLSYDPEEIEWTSLMYSHLPDTLTSLKPIYQSCRAQFTALIDALPSTVRRVEVLHIPIDISVFLTLLTSKELTELSTNKINSPIYASQDIKLLPRTLTTLECGNLVSPFLDQAGISALPPSLIELIGLKAPHFVFKPKFDHLPHLTALESVEGEPPLFSPKTVKRLPHSLISLAMAGEIDQISKSDWPPHLSYLCLEPSSASYHHHFDSFPSGLTSLSITNTFAMPMSSISLFPHTLLHISIMCGKIDFENRNIAFPPNLESLELSRPQGVEWLITKPPTKMRKYPLVVSCFPFHTIPQSVEHLFWACSIPASQLIHLPPRLKTLWCNMFVDADFNSKDTRHLSRMTELYKIGASQGIDSPASHVSLPASINSLLPRTLTHLTVLEPCTWLDTDWSRLPPHLETLECDDSEHPVSAKLFLSAPLSRLRTMKLSLTNFTDDLVRLMPKSLTCFEIIGSSTTLPKLTLACIPYWPYNLGPNHFSAQLQKAFKKLHAKRIEAITSSSTELFPKLFPHQ